MRKKMCLWLVIFGLAAAVTGCFRQVVRTITIEVPQLKSADCAKRIQDALGRVEGVQSATADIPKRQLVVTYDSEKVAIKNIEAVVAGAGFDANSTPAKSEARATLPAECR